MSEIVAPLLPWLITIVGVTVFLIVHVTVKVIVAWWEGIWK